MTARNDRFRRDIARILTDRADKAEAIARAGAMMLLNRLVDGSAVGNPTIWKNPAMMPPGYVGGRFKGNWVVEAGSFDTKNDHAPDGSGGAALSRGYSKITNWRAAGHLFITNSVPYAKRLEYDAWSQQMPAGVVRITVADYRQIISQVARQMR